MRAEPQTIRDAVAYRLLRHEQLLGRWVYDLGACSLRAVLPVPARPQVLVRQPESAMDVAAVLEGEDDGDDRSSAYASDEDGEDEPNAELLDELGVGGEEEHDNDAEQGDGQVREHRHLLLDLTSFQSAAVIAAGVTDAPMLDDGAKVNESSSLTLHAASACTIEASDSLSDDERATAFEARMKKPRVQQYEVRKWRCGRWSCLEEDFARLDSRNRWLSGDGIAVFAAAQLKAANVDTVDVIHPLLLQEVEWRADALAAGKTVQAKLNADHIVDVLREARALQDCR